MIFLSEIMMARRLIGGAARKWSSSSPFERAVPAIVAVTALISATMLVIQVRGAGSERGAEMHVRSQTLPPGPLGARERASAVWTGREVIIWGGQSGAQADNRLYSDGAAYDPARGTWRTIPRPPIAPRSGHTAVWTGHEMIVWGGHTDTGQSLLDGASFSPSTNQWRRLPPAPTGNTREYGKGLWVDNTLVIGGGAGWGEGTEQAPQKLLVYLPEQMRWKEIRLENRVYDVSAGPTGVYVLTLNRRDRSVNVADVDPRSGRIRRLPSPASPATTDGLGLAWTGGHLYVTLGTPASTRIVELSSSDAWRNVGAVQAGIFHPAVSVSMDPQSHLSVWTGRAVLNYSPYGLEAFAPRERKTIRVVGDFGRSRGYCGAGAATTWTGSEIISWGGQSCRAGGPPQTSTGIRIAAPDTYAASVSQQPAPEGQVRPR